jgi:hypothetical protein
MPRIVTADEERSREATLPTATDLDACTDLAP